MMKIRFGVTFSVTVFLGTCTAVAAPPVSGARPSGTNPAAARPAESKPLERKPSAPGGNLVTITAANPSAFARTRETIALSGSELSKLAPGFELKKALVIDSGGRPVLSQLVDMTGDDEPDELVFQADFGPGEA